MGICPLGTSTNPAFPGRVPRYSVRTPPINARRPRVHRRSGIHGPDHRVSHAQQSSQKLPPLAYRERSSSYYVRYSLAQIAPPVLALTHPGPATVADRSERNTYSSSAAAARRRSDEGR